jgi:hypothetical protein
VNGDEYAAKQAVISAATASYVFNLGKLFATPFLGIAEWLRLLELLYPEVSRQRQLSAALAREFYDTQRARFDAGRHDQLLEEFPFETFAKSMEPARRRLSQENAPDHSLGDLARVAVTQVENGGRRQIIRAVKTDNGTVKGWARVATGNETCGWCLMLVSRGPVYLSAERAGLNVNDTSAQQMIASGTDVSELMDEWHVGCDCKVVPVFDRKNWIGKEAADRALEIWNDATREAEEFRKQNPGRKHSTGQNAGKEFTLNEDAILALRRRLARGEDTSGWAGLRAA